jgi:heat shock protein HslJ
LRTLLGRTVAAVTLVAVLVTSGCGSDDSEKLVGRWEPIDVPSVNLAPSFDRSAARITFDDGGGWTASDGCNDMTGEYTLDDGGSFTVDAGSVAGVGCSGGQIPYDLLLSQAEHVTFKPDGTAVFESSEDELLLTLTPVP